MAWFPPPSFGYQLRKPPTHFFFQDFNEPTLLFSRGCVCSAGDCDWICNYMGNEAWTLKLDWAGGEGFRAAPQKDWTVRGSNDAAGLSRSYGGLTFLQVYEAGHMVSNGRRVCVYVQ